MSARRFGWIAMVAGAMTAAMPFVPWFRVDASGPVRRVRAIDAAGELWAMSIVGAIVVAIGCAVLVARVDAVELPGRWAGGATAFCGIAALGWAAKATFDVNAIGVPQVPNGPPAPLEVQPLAFLAIVVTCCVALLGLTWLREGHIRGAASERGPA